MSQVQGRSHCLSASEAVAVHIAHEIPLEAGSPAPEWGRSTPVSFCADWQGTNPDSQRETTVHLLWSDQKLYLRFECKFRELHVFEDSDADGHRDHLWDRDVAEVFIQPDPSRTHEYKEFEISPNGMWIDLAISNGALADLKSGLQRSAHIDQTSHTWAAEMAIPLKALDPQFDANAHWRVNFFRVEGKKEPRGYYAWRPTGTPEPNFHVPEAFGILRFRR